MLPFPWRLKFLMSQRTRRARNTQRLLSSASPVTFLPVRICLPSVFYNSTLLQWVMGTLCRQHPSAVTKEVTAQEEVSRPKSRPGGGWEGRWRPGLWPGRRVNCSYGAFSTPLWWPSHSSSALQFPSRSCSYQWRLSDTLYSLLPCKGDPAFPR